MARTKTRRQSDSSKKKQQWLAEVAEVAERERRYHLARQVWDAPRKQRAKLRNAHAVCVDMFARRAGVVIGTPGAVPDGLDVPGHREFVEEIHAVQPWFPPPDACVRGADDDDPREVVRVLIALERGHTLRTACHLALEATPFQARQLRGLTSAECLRKRAVRARVGRDGVELAGAYTRWRAALERHVAVSARVSVNGESREEYERRIRALRGLLALHS